MIAIFVGNTTGFAHIGSKMFIDDLAWGSATDVKDINISNPIQFSLEQNYPNPFNPSTTISWQSPVGSWQSLKVYDVLGNEVANLVDEYRDAGKYEIEFSAENLASGIYFYKLQTGTFHQIKKMVLLR